MAELPPLVVATSWRAAEWTSVFSLVRWRSTGGRGWLETGGVDGLDRMDDPRTGLNRTGGVPVS